MITYSIKDRADLQFELRGVQGSGKNEIGQSDQQYQEFSQTLDQIATKVFKNHKKETAARQQLNALEEPTTLIKNKSVKPDEKTPDVPSSVKVDPIFVRQVVADVQKPLISKASEKPVKSAKNDDSSRANQDTEQQDSVNSEDDSKIISEPVDQSQDQIPVDPEPIDPTTVVQADSKVSSGVNDSVTTVQLSEAAAAVAQTTKDQVLEGKPIEKAPEQKADIDEEHENPTPSELPFDQHVELAKQQTPEQPIVAKGSQKQDQVPPAPEQVLPKASEDEIIADVVTAALKEVVAPIAEKETEVASKTKDDAALFENAIKNILLPENSGIKAAPFGAEQVGSEALLNTILGNVMGPNKGIEGLTNPNQTQAQGLQLNANVDVGASKQADFAQRGETSKMATKPLPKAAELRTMEKVENALKEVARSKDGKTISLRLDPPDLGTVKIDMSYRDGGMHARLVAESPAVNNLLREKAHEVVAMLRKLGLQMEKVTVSVGSGSEQQNGAHESFESNKGGQTPQKQGQQGQGQGQNFGPMHGAAAGTERRAVATEDHWIA